MIKRKKKKQSIPDIITALSKKLATTIRIARIGSKNRKRFYRKLSFRMDQGLKAHEAVTALLDDMVPPARTLEESEKNRKNIETKKMMGRMLSHVAQVLRDKGELGIALDGWVPESDLLIIRGADQSKTQGSTLLELNRINENLSRVQKQATLAAIVPIGMLILGVAAMVAMAGQIGPMIEDLSRDGNLTMSQELMMTLSAVAQAWWFEIAIAIVALIITAIVTLPLHWGRLEWLRVQFDKIPPWSLYRKVMGIRFFAALTLMVRHQMIAHAMQDLRDGSKNAWLNHRVGSAIPMVSDGLNLGTALRKLGHGFPDKEIIDDLVTLSDGGNQERMIDEIYREWMKNITEEIEAQSAIIRKAAGFILFGVTILILAAMKDTFNIMTSSLPG